MSTILPHGIIQINEGNISWYGDITANWQLIDSKIGEYDAAVASIPAPANNGTLTINYGGATIAMFGADDAGNVSADIPAPGDGTLTIQLNGTDVQTFTANQAGDVTANIVTTPVNDGTLTIMVDGITVGTFSANQSTDTIVALTSGGGGGANDGTLTIQKNGDTVGTFSANQATDETINITVPDVNDATLTIQQNGTNVQTFTANQATAATANIQCVDLTNNQTVGGIKTFSNAPVVNSISLDGKSIDTDANGNMTYDSHIVDTIEEQGNNYIRYSSGLQICWGNVDSDIVAWVDQLFPKPFKDATIYMTATQVYAPNAEDNFKNASVGVVVNSNTTFSVTVYNSSFWSVNYYAIGQWK